MKNILSSIIIVAFISLVLSSCHKSTTNTYSSVADFIKKNGAATQTFTLDAGAGGTITGSQGTVFTFPAGAFVTSANQAVTGTVSVQIREIYSNADMIFSNKTTVANGNIPLISGGEFFLQVTQNNQPLNIAPFKAYTAQMSFDTPGYNMQVYHANGNDSVNNVQWAAVQDSQSIVTSNQYGYVLYGDSINWMNCDGVYPNPGGVYYQITANAVGCPNIPQTLVYVFVNGHHAVWNLSPLGGNQFQTPTDIVPNVPLTIVGYCISGGQVYSAITPVNVTGNQTITLNFAATTDVAFIAAVKALN